MAHALASSTFGRVTAGLFLLLTLEPQRLCAERIQPQSVLEVDEEDVRMEEGVDTNTSSLMYWGLFGESGPHMSDIRQGMLHNSWYLAGLAAIAQQHPEIIEQAFVNRTVAEQSGLNVYQLRFFVAGVETLVAMDEMVPMKRNKTQPGRKFHFAATHDGRFAWPVLLEKGLAKVFGSYLALDDGRGCEAFKAMTQAPVDIFRVVGDYQDGVWQDPEALWDTLIEATRKKFPMVAHSKKNSLWVNKNYVFAVVGVGSDPEYGRTVEVYNPEHKNKYKGTLAELTEKSNGNYNLTFEEFTEDFRSVEIARVRKGHNVYYKRVPVGKPVALKFTVQGSDSFAVQLEWPTPRFFDAHGCLFHPGEIKLLVARVGNPGFEFPNYSNYFYPLSNLRVDLEGPGEYVVYAFASFEMAPWAEEVVVNAYASENIVFEELEDPLAVGREIMGFPCQAVAVPLPTQSDEIYTALPHPVQGTPAWGLESASGSARVIWLNYTGVLEMAPSEDRSQEWRIPDFDPSTLKCAPNAPRELKKEEQERPEPDVVRKEVEKKCDWEVGEMVSYDYGDGNWTCAEIDQIFKPSEVLIRFLRAANDVLSCESKKLKKVTQCKYQKDDRVRVSEWTDERITEVNCGEVTLSNGQTVQCDANVLKYPHDCPFYQDEKVLVWSPTLERWTFTTVIHVEADTVQVDRQGVGVSEWLNCTDEHNLKKLSTCDKLSHDQIMRFRKLDNYQELAQGHEDSLFRPDLTSIGPQCGDRRFRRCAGYDTWGPISDMLE